MDYDAIDEAWAAAGHDNAPCGGWKYEPGTGVIRCACGTLIPFRAEQQDGAA